MFNAPAPCPKQHIKNTPHRLSFESFNSGASYVVNKLKHIFGLQQSSNDLKLVAHGKFTRRGNQITDYSLATANHELIILGPANSKKKRGIKTV